MAILIITVSNLGSRTATWTEYVTHW